MVSTMTLVWVGILFLLLGLIIGAVLTHLTLNRFFADAEDRIHTEYESFYEEELDRTREFYEGLIQNLEQRSGLKAQDDTGRDV